MSCFQASLKNNKYVQRWRGGKGRKQEGERARERKRKEESERGGQGGRWRRFWVWRVHLHCCLYNETSLLNSWNLRGSAQMWSRLCSSAPASRPGPGPGGETQGEELSAAPLTHANTHTHKHATSQRITHAHTKEQRHTQNDKRLSHPEQALRHWILPGGQQ